MGRGGEKERRSGGEEEGFKVLTTSFETNNLLCSPSDSLEM